jgi:transglutaminase-like putative cysteine protease
VNVRYRVRHETHYRYDGEVSLAYNRAVLTPRPAAAQLIVASSLRTAPDPAFRDDHRDAFGNRVTSFSIEQPHRELSVVCESEVVVGEPSGPTDPGVARAWEVAAVATARLHGAERVFCHDSPYVVRDTEVFAYALASFPPGRSLLEAVTDLTARIHRDFAYQPGATTIGTPVAEVLAGRAGVCQDFAHLQLACLRSMGLAARYVSGYLETRPPEGTPRLVGADASHAWCAVRTADGAWLDLDPTNDLVGPSTHITVAWGRDYGDVAPLSGVILAGRVYSTLSVAVDVDRIGPDPA